jgi:hypothetical protein
MKSPYTNTVHNNLLNTQPIRYSNSYDDSSHYSHPKSLLKTSMKRKSEADMTEYSLETSHANSSDSASKSRKRFVWPDDLHRDFIAAVFDFGLQHASVSDIHSLMPSLGKHEYDVSDHHIRAHIEKFKLFRDTHKVFHTRGGGGAITTNQLGHESSRHVLPAAVPPGISGYYLASEDANPIEINQQQHQQQRPIEQHVELLQEKLDNISSAILMQSNFMEMLKSSLAKQMKLQASLQEKLFLLSQSSTSSSSYAPHPLAQQLTNHLQQQHQQQYDDHSMMRAMYDGSEPKRDEESIKREFIGLVDHHQNLQRWKDGYYFISSSTSNAAAAAVDSRYDSYALDDNRNPSGEVVAEAGQLQQQDDSGAMDIMAWEHEDLFSFLDNLQ